MSRKHHREKMIRLFLGFVLLMSASLASMGHAAQAEDRQDAKLAISPTPQQLKVTGEGFPLTPVVGLVVGQKTDSDAIREVKNALHAADVNRIVTRKANEGKPETPVTIWIGGPSENPASMDALQSLGIEGPRDLRDEGYVLASGHGNGHKMIVLAGKDASGTFYAAQTFEQIILLHPGRDWIPSVEIRDWPQMAIRGTIEGFYGPPWSHQDRMSQIEFYGENKMNSYVYAPKDDPYHRDKWREPYPEKRLKQIRELVAKSQQNHVDFVFGLSPGKSICYSGDEDFQLLMDKMQKMYDIGIRSFAIFLDDISQNLRCGQDKERFGDESSPAAAAQAYLLNRFQDAFIETHEDTDRLVTVPTDYAGTSDSDYISLFAELVSPKVIVDWTGPAVVSHEITESQAEQASDIYEHDLLIWDNYPVNDYARNRLFLGPLVNRDPNLTEHGVLGITANPMNEAEASKISLYTVADYMWNSDDYEPIESWKRSLKAFAGDSYEALKTFAENSFSSPLQKKESLTLTPLIEDFWKAYETGNAELAGEKLITEFANVRNAPGQLRKSLDKENFLEEVAPYLDKLELYGKAGVAAVKMLMAQSDGDGEAVWKQRQILEQVLKATQEIPKRIAVGVIKPFLQKAVHENNDWLGIVAQHAETSMGTYESYSISNMTDGNPSTLYWSDESPNPGDAVSVDLGDVYTIQSIELLMGSTAGSVPRPDDYIHHGVLQYSRTGKIWRTIMQGDRQREIRLDTEGIKARYIRYKATANQSSWVQVREFQVVSDKGSVEVNGAPSADDQTSFAAAADGNIMTTYHAEREPKKGEALTFTYSKAGKLDQVVILQDNDSTAEASVQILNDNGEWIEVGTLSGGFSKIDIGSETKSIRLMWTGGSVPPVIYEAIPKWQHQNPNVIVPQLAVASSSETDWLTPDNAIDMDPATRWSSGRTDNEWIYIDLGEEYTINAVQLDWEAAYGKGYQIQVSSDKENWSTVYATTTGDGGIDQIQFDEVNARYVRMLGTDRATSYGYSLWGFQVFQADSSS